VIVHAVVIALVAAITAHVSDRTAAAAPVPTDIVYVNTPDPAPSHESPSPATPQAQHEPTIPAPPHTYVDVPPTTIPTEIPPIDLSVPPIDPSQFTMAHEAKRGVGGSDNSTSGGGSGTYTAWEVEKGTVPLPGNPKPRYPSMLQSARVEGEVLAQFVVDTTGRVDMSTFRAIQSTNELFVSSVRRALSAWKFRPAEVGGRKVRQLVQIPLSFTVR
jgi:protein TonB